MFSIPARIRLRQSRGVLLLGALLVGQIFCTAQGKEAVSRAFDGYWTYSNDCRFGHYAEITLAQKDTGVTGDWSDGTRVEGWDGSLKGNVRDGKLYAKYCSTEANGGHAVCPSYDTSESDYFVRQGHDLVWYRPTGQRTERTFEKYAVLHPSSKGKPGPVDVDCPDDN